MEIGGIGAHVLYSSSVTAHASGPAGAVAAPATIASPPPLDNDKRSVSGAVSGAVPGAVSGATQAEAEADTGPDTQSAKDSQTDSDASAGALTEQELAIVEDLAVRDREVRQHEQAHAAVGGQYTGAPSYELKRGPDGRMYAVNGEVSVDTSAIANDPEATIEKMQIVIAAALAPAEPSTQDYKVAATARALLAEAQAELARADKDEGDAQDAADSPEVETEGAEDAARDSTAPGTAPSAADESSVPAGQISAESAAETVIDGSRQLLAQNQEQLERRLVETGVFGRLFPSGSIIHSHA